MTQSDLEPRRHTSAGLPLRGLTGWAAGHPVWALLLSLACAAACVVYSFAKLDFKTQRADLIDSGTDYHQRWLNYTQSFGDESDMIVVIEGDDPDEIKEVIDDLGPRLEQEPDFFANALYRTDAGSSALSAKGLQQSSPDRLQWMNNWLGELGPVLKGRWNLYNLETIFQGLRHKIEQVKVSPGTETSSRLELILLQTRSFTESLDQFSSGSGKFRSPWPDMRTADERLREKANRESHVLNGAGTMGFITLEPVIGAGDSFSGAARSIQKLRTMITEQKVRFPEAKIGLTGIPVLEHDEMQQSQEAMFYASGISFLGVGILLIVGFRGIRHPLMALVMLAVAMAWSLGIATGVVGHLNILSVSFFAILIGLGIDFAIHYLARYLELRHAGQELVPALLETSTSVGPGIVTAGITTALAFYCAIFTEFLGVAELGVIAGSGILLCALAAFVVLPALVALCDRDTEPRRLPIPFQGRALKRLTSRHPVIVVTLSLGVIGYVSVYGLQVKYDSNLLHLQAEELESVNVQKRVFEQSDGSLLYAISLADSPRQALELKGEFEKLASVKQVKELASDWPRYSPQETILLVQAINAQLEKLPPKRSSLRELVGEDYAVEPEELGVKSEALFAKLSELSSPDAVAAAAALDRFLNRFEKLSLEKQVKLIEAYEERMTIDLLEIVHRLKGAADINPVSIDDFPAAVRTRMVSDDGKWLLQIFPAFEIWDHEPLEKFVKEIRTVDPEVTGTPLQNYEASRQIARSYQAVAGYALLAVFIVLLIDFHSIKDAILTLLPPLAGGALMMGILGLLGVDLNPANLIVLPLVIGIGVDDGVHVVHDFRQQSTKYRMSASTTNAIVLTSLTSMMGFGSMMIASHRGLYSLGLVLVVGVGACLFVSLVMLPALLTLISREAPRSHPWKFTDEGRTLARGENPLEPRADSSAPQATGVESPETS